MITLRDDQSELIQKTREAMTRHKSVLMQACTGFGKCLGINTPILMFDGTVKMVQNVKKGDKLMGPDSHSRTVQSTCTGREKLYKIIPVSGEPFVCNESHILSLKRTNTSNKRKYHENYITRTKKKGTIENITVKDWLNSSNTFKHRYKLWRVGIDFINQAEALPLSPYFVGAWLGDGCSRTTSITSMDKEIVDCVHEEARINGLMVRKEEISKTNKSHTYFITSGINGNLKKLAVKNKVREKLKTLNLIQNKHIPFVYKTSSRNNRLELLAGILDTDGSLQGNCFDIIQKRKVLADDIAYLARSLGFSAYIKECRKECVNNGVWGTYYRVSISGHTDEISTRIMRKKAAPRKQIKNHLFTGFKVEDLGVGDYYGFEISGNDRLFLLGDFTVTHNTVCTSFMVQSAVNKGKRAMMVMPRRQLVTQTSNTFSEMGIDHSFVASGYGYNPYSSAYVATTDTLSRRLDKAPLVDLLICDETHHGSTSLDAIIKHYKAAGSYIIGLSATPWKLSGRGLSCWYDEMVCGKSMRWLIDNKKLSDYRMFAPDHPDLSSIPKIAGDYNQKILNDKMENDRVLIGSAVKHYRDHAIGRLNVSFCTSIKHSEIVAQKFNDDGVPAASVSGETPKDELLKIIRAYARRELLVLTCADLLVFGFDLASYSGYDVTVECLSDLAPTQSLAKQMQKWGRALRYKDFPALIFDHSSNVQTHNMPCAERDWTLADREKNVGIGKERILPARTCPKCDFTSPPKPTCGYCGYEFQIQSREIDEIDGELQEITDIKLKADKKKRRAACKTLDELVKFAEDEGYKSPRSWAALWFTKRQQYGGRR